MKGTIAMVKDIIIEVNKNKMTTIYSINADGQERYDTVQPEMVGKTINILKRKGQLNVRVVW